GGSAWASPPRGVRSRCERTTGVYVSNASSVNEILAPTPTLRRGPAGRPDGRGRSLALPLALEWGLVYPPAADGTPSVRELAAHARPGRRHHRARPSEAAERARRGDAAGTRTRRARTPPGRQRARRRDDGYGREGVLGRSGHPRDGGDDAGRGPCVLPARARSPRPSGGAAGPRRRGGARGRAPGGPRARARLPPH